MSGETEREVSGWTVDTLHIHIDQQLHDLRDHLDERFESQQDMVRTALVQNDKRFESVNEFRAQLNDQVRTFLTRVEYQTAHSALSEKVDTLQARVDDATGMQRATVRMIGFGLTVTTIMLSVVIFAANYFTGH
jgi:hypothetical protein